MKVILKADVNKVGREGELVNVSDGYARNFLFPRGVADEATPKRIEAWKQEQARRKAKEEKLHQEALEVRKNLQGKAVKVNAKAGDNGKLFGSVTAAQVADALEQQYQVKADKRDIKMDAAIREPGKFPFTVKLFTGVQAEMTLVINAAKA